MSATSQIIPFDFETHSVRAVLRDGEHWWVAVDVCRVLEHSNSRKAVSSLDEDERQKVNLNTVSFRDGISGNPNVTIINESGLYALILRSNKPAAKRFRKWVTAEVLPQLRREGSYSLRSRAEMEEISAKRLIELLEAENTLLRQKAGVKGKRAAVIPTTKEERAEIKRLIGEGHPLKDIARMTGRSASMISLYRSALKAEGDQQ